MGLKGSSGLCYLKANTLSGASRYGKFSIPVVLIKSQRKESNLLLFQPHEVILIQSYAWILQCVVSVFSELEGDLAASAHTQHPPPVKHLRWQFTFPGAQELPGQRGRREDRAGLACRCSQRRELFPLDVGRGGHRTNAEILPSSIKIRSSS